MYSESLRFGLIGAGGIGAVRASALERAAECSLTAALDIEAGRIASLAGTPRAFDSSREFFDSGLFEAVIICTPPNTHRELALEALQHGIHVLVEKPMAESVLACREMIDAAGAAQRILAVGFNHRFFKGVQVVRNAVSDGTIGKLSWIRAFSGHTGLAEFKAPWMYDKSVMGGGTLMDNGVHLLDLVCHLMGDIVTVNGHVRHDFWHLDVEDNAFLNLTDSQGVVCDFHSSWTEWKGYRFFVEAYGDRGMAGMYYAPMRTRITTIDEKGTPLHTQRNFFPVDIVREKVFGWQSTVIDTFVLELGEFIARIRGDNIEQAIAARGEHGLLACQLANLAYESAATGRTIQV